MTMSLPPQRSSGRNSEDPLPIDSKGPSPNGSPPQTGEAGSFSPLDAGATPDGHVGEVGRIIAVFHIT